MTSDERRRQENADLIARMKRGESLARCDTQATWWQPRPKIKKDDKALDLIFTKDGHGKRPPSDG